MTRQRCRLRRPLRFRVAGLAHAAEEVRDEVRAAVEAQLDPVPVRGDRGPHARLKIRRDLREEPRKVHAAVDEELSRDDLGRSF